MRKTQKSINILVQLDLYIFRFRFRFRFRFILSKIQRKSKTMLSCYVMFSLAKQKQIGLMKYGVDEKIMTKFIRLRTKTCSYLTDNNDEDIISKGKKMCHKRNTLI